MVSACSSSSLRLSWSFFFSSWCASSSSHSSATFTSKSSSSACASASPHPRSLQRRRHSTPRGRLGFTLGAVRVVHEHLRQQRRVRRVCEADGVVALLVGVGGVGGVAFGVAVVSLRLGNDRAPCSYYIDCVVYVVVSIQC
ncbi:hypothetical protein PR002_g14469 [Phytophthora rubi]|uniref:Uncharacterized protein n=1 Tax=Phytophthora rubi TaxID=129364 RepID=A0A6A3L3G0_9STRA|nr:hypothetical protein PR002_g14469 [Phytophthora rubi]